MMQLIMIDGCPLRGTQARSWENDYGTWAECPNRQCPMVATPVSVWNALSQTRSDLLATQRALATAAPAERERCARIAESFIPSGFSGTYGTARNDRARTIADAIRNEETP